MVRNYDYTRRRTSSSACFPASPPASRQRCSPLRAVTSVWKLEAPDCLDPSSLTLAEVQPAWGRARQTELSGYGSPAPYPAAGYSVILSLPSDMESHLLIESFPASCKVRMQVGRLRRARQLLLVLAAIVALVWVVSVVHHPLDGWGGGAMAVLYGNDTEYAPGYSEKEFGRLKPGISMKEVEERLGRPLEEYVIGGDEIGWKYTRSPRDMSYRVRVVIFKAGFITEVIHEFYMD